MGYLIGSAVAALLVTILAARFVVSRWPAMPFGGQVWRAAMSFPLLAMLLFAIAVVVMLLQPAPPGRPDLSPAAPIFAFTFFLIYALAVGVVVGLPTALVAVRAFRPG